MHACGIHRRAKSSSCGMWVYSLSGLSIASAHFCYSHSTSLVCRSLSSPIPLGWSIPIYRILSLTRFFFNCSALTLYCVSVSPFAHSNGSCPFLGDNRAVTGSARGSANTHCTFLRFVPSSPPSLSPPIWFFLLYSKRRPTNTHFTLHSRDCCPRAQHKLCYRHSIYLSAGHCPHISHFFFLLFFQDYWRSPPSYSPSFLSLPLPQVCSHPHYIFLFG
ncbi:hypothetical protein GQ42DRAFT_82327 [Ramicandelaber brevisporus]|nr:hypothetical protein GQ42DRAFT_82327 [Ramicandelaber brevisporus]